MNWKQPKKEIKEKDTVELDSDGESNFSYSLVDEERDYDAALEKIGFVGKITE